MTIYFAILHYKRSDVTSRCISSILNLDPMNKHDVKVVIVDNASNNGSFERLRKEYKQHKNIVWISSDENLGFAKGNNLAFKYIQEADDAYLAVFLNNDTEIIQTDFIQSLCNYSESTNSDVLSIDVYDPYAKQHQSPLCLGDNIMEYAFNESKRADAVLNMGIVKKIYTSTKNLAVKYLFRFEWFRKILQQRIQGMTKSAPEWEFDHDNVVPNGSCIIFSEHYIKNSDFAFYPKTNMYFEECILKLICDKQGFKISYTPDLQVLHHHHEFDETSLDKYSLAKLRLKAQREIDSYKEFISLCQ